LLVIGVFADLFKLLLCFPDIVMIQKRKLVFHLPALLGKVVRQDKWLVDRWILP